MNAPVPLTEALSVVRQVRAMLLPHYGKVAHSDKHPEATEDVVTALDIAVEDFLQKRLASLFPDISFVGEEKGGNRDRERFWLADPIDGTTYFVRGLPLCTTQVALVDHGEVVFSVIYDFVQDVMYSAEKGRGATANGKTIRVSDRALRQSRLAWAIDLNHEEYLRSFLLLKRRCHLFHTGASGIEFAMVASGKLDGAIYLGAESKDYDITPGTFLVQEAGGVVANTGKDTYDYRTPSFLAMNPKIFEELTKGEDALFPIF